MTSVNIYRRKKDPGVTADDGLGGFALGAGLPTTFGEAVRLYRAVYSASSWCRNVGNVPRAMGPADDPIATKERFQCASFSEKVVLAPGARVVAVGDIHSDLRSLGRVLDGLCSRGVVGDDLIVAAGFHVVFLGDMVDGGSSGLEVLHLVFGLKVRNPGTVHVLNGNHEDFSMYARYGFNDELERRLADPRDRRVVHELLTLLPTALFVSLGDEGWIQFNHAGISEGYHPLLFLEAGEFDLEFHGFDAPGRMVNAGLRWNDFNGGIRGTAPSTWRESGGGEVREHGTVATEAYLAANGLEGIVRGHQDTVSCALMARPSGCGRGRGPSSRGFSGVLRQAGMVYPAEDHWAEPVVGGGDGGAGWERVSVADAFRDFSVVTTSTAVGTKGVTHHTYLEIRGTRDEVREQRGIVSRGMEFYGRFAREAGLEDVLARLVGPGDLLGGGAGGGGRGAEDGRRWDVVVRHLKRSGAKCGFFFPLLFLDSVLG